MSAAVHPVGGFVVTGCKGALLAEGDRFHATGIDSQLHQTDFDRLCSPIPQGQIVFLGSSFVAMAFNYNRGVGKLLKPPGILFEDLLSLGTDSRLIVLKKQGLDFSLIDGLLETVDEGKNQQKTHGQLDSLHNGLL